MGQYVGETKNLASESEGPNLPGNCYLNPANSGQIMTINKVNLFVFEVGPSAKFVSAIIDAILKKKWG